MRRDAISGYTSVLRAQAEQSVWLPPRIKLDGTVENIVQGRIDLSGAGKGETNYKTRKRPTKFGQFQIDQGTFVANMHFTRKVEGSVYVNAHGHKRIRPTCDGIVVDGDGKTKMLKLGKMVKISSKAAVSAPGCNHLDGIGLAAVRRALEKLSRGDVKFMSADDSQEGRTGMVNSSVEGLPMSSRAEATLH